MSEVKGAAKIITEITKANPGLVKSKAHGFANGIYVLLHVEGMTQVDGRVFQVANQAADTFELKGEDTTLFDTFSTGTAEEITFGITMPVVRGLPSSGGSIEEISDQVDSWLQKRKNERRD